MSKCKICHVSVQAKSGLHKPDCPNGGKNGEGSKLDHPRKRYRAPRVYNARIRKLEDKEWLLPE